MSDLRQVAAAVADARRLAALSGPGMMGRYLLSKAFVMRPHTRVICDALAGLGGDYRRLLITTPPQIGKSTCASVLAPFWWLAKNPRRRVVLASYGQSLAMRNSRDVREHVRAHGTDFGLTMRRDSRAKNEWYLEAGGGVKAVGIGGGITGFRADIISIDDPVKDRAQAESKVWQENVLDWWSGAIISRQSVTASIVLTMTRWHPNDLAGYVLATEGRLEDGGRWKVVHLPAIADLELTGPDLLDRADGDPLTHPEIDEHDRERLLAHWADLKLSSSPRDWGSMYQGNPRPTEGALITHAEMRALRLVAGEKAPEPVRVAVGIDPSGGGQDTAGVIAGFLGTDGRLYITHDRTQRMSSDKWSRTACMLAYETGASVFFMERFAGDGADLILRTAWDRLIAEGAIEEGAPCPYIASRSPKTAKLVRAEPIAQQMREGRIRLVGPFIDFEAEWSQYDGSGASPGRIDASVYLAYGLLKVPGADRHLSTPAGRSISAAQNGSGMGAIGR